MEKKNVPFVEQNPLNEITSERLVGTNLTGRILVFRPTALAERYQQLDRRFLAQGGFGCSPTAMGSAVYGVRLLDGEEARWERGDFMGFAADTTPTEFIKLSARGSQ